MPETTPTRPDQAYYSISATVGAGEPEASRLLVDGQQLLQESKAAEAEPLLRRALEIYERQDNIPAEGVQALSDLASIATTRGDLTAAESLLQRALTLANSRPGTDHSDAAAILGGLARLYLRRNELTKAEPLLQQLLEIKRARGDDHPEVATVLASIATVHSAMGAHESAERILRRVLAIRERALAPNHFATTTTVEHLAESCEARGKFEEALSLLHRALAMRERTLGVSHPSIVAARTRIADLELLSSNEELGWVPMSAPMAVPMFVPTSAPMMDTLPEIDAPLEEAVESDPPPPEEAVDVSEAPPEAVHDELYDEHYDEWADEFEEPRGPVTLLDRLDAKLALATAFARTPRGRLTIVAIGVGSLLAALVLATQTRADVAVVQANASTVPSRSAASVSRSVADVSLKPATARPAPAPANARLARSTDVARRSMSPTESVRRSARSDESETVIANDELVALPKALKVKAFDAPIVGAPVAPVSAPLVASTDFTPSRVSPPARSTAVGAANSARTRTFHAVLLEDNPAPEYPADLMRRRVEGRVMAEFLVDTKGRVDTRTLRIISSTDEGFSQAVRNVLPRLRFAPAESGGVKTEEWVEMPFRFSPKTAAP